VRSMNGCLGLQLPLDAVEGIAEGDVHIGMLRAGAVQTVCIDHAARDRHLDLDCVRTAFVLATGRRFDGHIAAENAIVKTLQSTRELAYTGSERRRRVEVTIGDEQWRIHDRTTEVWVAHSVDYRTRTRIGKSAWSPTVGPIPYKARTSCAFPVKHRPRFVLRIGPMLESHRHRLGVYQRHGEGYLIEMKLHDARQLFNTLDPSPFHEKDLDPAAEEYLVSAVREIGGRPSKLVIHVPLRSPGEDGRALIAAVRHYFDYRALHTSEQLRLLLGRGIVSFAIGLVFLFACLSLRQMLETALELPRAEILSEGLLILGWVAMWRPVEIFLYDWWPELGKRRLFARIARMEIETRSTERVADARAHAIDSALSSLRAANADFAR
jgi:hypothetical protein